MAKSKHETHVKPNFDKIIELKKEGKTEKEIAELLNVSELSLERANELEKRIIERALGYKYTETKVIKEKGKVVREEIHTKQMPPSEKLLMFCIERLGDGKWVDTIQQERLELEKGRLAMELKTKQNLLELRNSKKQNVINRGK